MPHLTQTETSKDWTGGKKEACGLMIAYTTSGGGQTPRAIALPKSGTDARARQTPPV